MEKVVKSERQAILLLAFLGSVCVADLEAQSGYQMRIQFDIAGDSVAAVPDTGRLDLVLRSLDFRGSGLDSFALRLAFDGTKLEFVEGLKLCPDVSVPLNLLRGDGYVDVSTSSCNGSYDQQIARLTFRLRAGAADGGTIGLRALALTDNGGLDRTADFVGDFAEVCHASALWGDVDDNLKINSRDALVTLSAAVGLPTPGFKLARGDVDGDGAVSARDALFIVAASIELPTPGARVGRWIPDRCVPQVLLPRPLYFSRGGTTPGQAAFGSGLSIRAALDSAVTVVGGSADALLYYQWRPRVSPDGSTVLFVCLDSSNLPNVCKANADGSGVVRLTSGSSVDQSPDWSPDGSQIVFVRGGQLYTMNPDGSGVALVPSSPTGVRSVAWQPVAGSRRVAYTIGGYGVSAGVHTRSLDSPADDLLVVGAPSCCVRYDVRFVDWSPAGDWLVFDVLLNGNRVVMVAGNVAGAAPRTVASWVSGAVLHPAWTDQGLLFSAFWNGLYRLFLLKPDGTVGRIGRGDNRDNLAPGMLRQ
jgi:hypothetical protein